MTQPLQTAVSSLGNAGVITSRPSATPASRAARAAPRQPLANVPLASVPLASVPLASVPLASVEATLNYHVPNGKKPVIRVVPAGTGESQREAPYAPYQVQIHDGRPLAADLSLDRQGFALVRHDTAVEDFYDADEVRAVYYPEIERLVKQATGAAKVVVFDHNNRVDGDGKEGVRKPVRTVHNDYTLRSGPQRVRDLLGEEDASALLNKRFAVINVWRPIRGPVQRAPLAIADAQSVAPDDFVAADLVYQDRTGEIYDVAHSPEHRWYYFPQMERDEALLLKCYDSAEDGRARFTAHTAFDDPTAPASAAPRESIETRTLVFFD